MSSTTTTERPEKERVERHTSLSQLSEYDDIATDLFVDSLFMRESYRTHKMQIHYRPRINTVIGQKQLMPLLRSYTVHLDANKTLLEMIGETTSWRHDGERHAWLRYLRQLLECKLQVSNDGLQCANVDLLPRMPAPETHPKWIGSSLTCRTSASYMAFLRHLKRYLALYHPEAGYEITETERYHNDKTEAMLIATRAFTPFESLGYCSGATVQVSEAQFEQLQANGNRDFSVIYSERLKTNLLFLGTARFANHDCQPNCKLVPNHQRGEVEMTLQAVRHINPGEELTVFYAADYFGEKNCECLCVSCETLGRNGFASKEQLENLRKRERKGDENVAAAFLQPRYKRASQTPQLTNAPSFSKFERLGEHECEHCHNERSQPLYRYTIKYDAEWRVICNGCHTHYLIYGTAWPSRTVASLEGPNFKFNSYKGSSLGRFDSYKKNKLLVPNGCPNMILDHVDDANLVKRIREGGPFCVYVSPAERNKPWIPALFVPDAEVDAREMKYKLRLDEVMICQWDDFSFEGVLWEDLKLMAVDKEPFQSYVKQVPNYLMRKDVQRALMFMETGTLPFALQWRHWGREQRTANAYLNQYEFGPREREQPNDAMTQFHNKIMFFQDPILFEKFPCTIVEKEGPRCFIHFLGTHLIANRWVDESCLVPFHFQLEPFLIDKHLACKTSSKLNPQLLMEECKKMFEKTDWQRSFYVREKDDISESEEEQQQQPLKKVKEVKRKPVEKRFSQRLQKVQVYHPANKELMETVKKSRKKLKEEENEENEEIVDISTPLCQEVKMPLSYPDSPCILDAQDISTCLTSNISKLDADLISLNDTNHDFVVPFDSHSPGESVDIVQFHERDFE